MKAADAGNEIGAIDGRTSFGISRNPAHRGGKAGSIANARLLSVQLSASLQGNGDIGLRRAGKPISRHPESAVGQWEVVEIGV
jgi:hypothetical protein